MTRTQTATAVELPTGRWVIDPGHTEVGFVGRHLGLTKIRGRFLGVTGTVTVCDVSKEITIELDLELIKEAA